MLGESIEATMQRDIDRIYRHAMLLKAIAHAGECNRAELARETNIPYGTVKRDVRVFRAIGWVEWQPYGPIHATESGRYLAALADEYHMDHPVKHNNNGRG